MDILKKLFGLSSSSAQEQPDIVFGRYTDAYKDRDKYEAWDRAMAEFDKENYLSCFENFFFYLRDDDSENVKFKTTDGIVYFEIFQGSKLLVGTADPMNIRVESKIAKAESLNIGLLRRLLELNFSLKYGRYALDANNWITMIFDAKTRDTNPYKLYYGLKEIALNSDKQDDILESEFGNLEAINTSHIKQIPTEHLKVKFDFLQNEIDKVFAIRKDSKINLDNYPGALAYLCLDVIYRLDYLLKPEGYTMEKFEKLHREFFENNGDQAGLKNANLCAELKNLRERSFENFKEELYEVTSTFGITQPSGHDRLVEFIKGELPNVKFYENNGHYHIAQSIYNYMVGYCLFNYSLPSPDKAFLHLYYLIVNFKFFEKLGFNYNFFENDKLNKSAINNEIKKISRIYSEEYGSIEADTKMLNFDSVLNFSKTYLLMLSAMSLSPSKNVNV